ncbi:MAG: nuclear transport factor 2 family protein [Spirochaetota bacterium]
MMKKNTISFSCTTLVFLVITACKSSPSLKQKTREFIAAVNTQDKTKVERMVAKDYIQHNPFVPTGRDAFISLFPVLKKFKTKAETVRMLQDGNYVVLHNKWHNAKPFGADKMVAFDVLRFDKNGQIAEHWDALTVLREKTASGRTQTDGPTLAKAPEKTQANKARAQALVEDILMGKNPKKITEYISTEKYHQHNPDIKDGLSGIIAAVKALTAQNNMFKYTKIHKVLGEGDFVLTISEGEWSGKKQAFYDLFRFENGKAVEHWDIIQEIPSKKLANKNGMFGFKNDSL